MPASNFTLGKDVVLNVNTPNGPFVLPATVTGFESKAEYSAIKSKPLNGVNIEISIPEGWRGSITLDRSDASVDTFFARQEAGYYAGQNLLTATITESIREADGTVSVFLYTGVSLRFDEAGKKTSDAKIQQTIGFFASQRVQLA